LAETSTAAEASTQIVWIAQCTPANLFPDNRFVPAKPPNTLADPKEALE
jgi:hypothetical protein